MSTLDTFEKAPGTYITEAASPPPPPVGIPRSTGAMFGVTQTGPIGKISEVRSLSEWERIFGMYISETYPVWKHVKKFFQNGGTRLVFVRIVHYTTITDNTTSTAVKATAPLYDDDKSVAGIVAASVAGGGNAGDEGAGVSAGTYVGVSGEFRVVITSVTGVYASATADIYFTPSGGSESLVGSLTAGQIISATPFALADGATLTLTDGADTNLNLADEWTVGVTAPAYDTADIRITANAIYAGAYYNDVSVKVEASTLGIAGEFKLSVYLNSVLAETAFDNLSLDTAAANYFVTVVNNPNTGSGFVRLVDSLTNSNALALTLGLVALTTGDDGLTSLAKTDYIGDATAETGLELLAKSNSSLVIGCPDYDNHADQADVVKAVDDFIQNRHPTSFQVVSVPKAKTPVEAKTWFTTTLALDSPYYAAYYCWILDSDDDSLISPTGAIVGLFGRYADAQEFGIWWSPAGYDAQLKGVSGIELIVGPVNAGVLNENRVNLIKIIDQKGVTVYGARTGAITRSADFKYIGARLNTSYIEKLIETNTQWAPLRPNNTSLWESITAIVNQMLNKHWRDGGFDGEGKGSSYAVICNSSVNTLATKNAGLVVCRVGIFNLQTAEFIWFNIEQLSSGGSNILES